MQNTKHKKLEVSHPNPTKQIAKPRKSTHIQPTKHQNNAINPNTTQTN